MLDIGYVMYFGGLLAVVLFAAKKEIPLFVVFHSLLQYVFTILGWYGAMDSQGTGLLLMGLIVSTLCLFWGSTLSETQTVFPIQLFFTISSWVILLVLGLFAWIKSPYDYGYLLTESLPFHEEPSKQVLPLHPLIKIGGNVLIFMGFLQISLAWRRIWTLQKSLLDLSPLGIYLLMLTIWWWLRENGGGQTLT